MSWFSLYGHFCGFIVDSASNNRPDKKIKMCVDAEFWANSSRDLRLFLYHL